MKTGEEWTVEYKRLKDEEWILGYRGTEQIARAKANHFFICGDVTEVQLLKTVTTRERWKQK